MEQTVDVSTGPLKELLDSMESELKSLAAETAALERTVTSLRDMAEGEAADAFAAAASGDIRELEQTARSMEEYIQRSRDACCAYEDCERRAAQIVADIRV